jgi:hypothetical protein
VFDAWTVTRINVHAGRGAGFLFDATEIKPANGKAARKFQLAQESAPAADINHLSFN